MKPLLTLAIAIAGLALPSSAGATIVQPAVGDPVVADGQITFRYDIVNTTCRIELDGSVGTGGLSVTGLASTTAGCTLGSVVLTQLGDIVYGQAAGLLDGTWRWNVVATATMPIFGQCIWSGAFSGTWSYVVDTVLTVSANSFTKVGGGALCPSRPTTTGAIVLTDVEST